MDIKRFLAVAGAVAVTAAMFGCGDSSSSEPESGSSVTEENAPQPVTQGEETTEPLPDPPVPAECSDPNGITFDDEDISFAGIKADDPDSAQGELSVVEIQGNRMLKFTDSGTNFADGTVQKILFDGAKLLSPENLAKVRSIEMDVYADATAEELENEDGSMVKAPGWIGGGGGANVAGDTWYDFSEWEGGEYNFEMSGAVHVEMKFLLAAGGKCWDETMEEATFQIMRWGAQNEGNMYIDNIVFLDEDGNSLPIEKSAADDGESAEATDESETAVE
ncbi:MAG: hypothetical protein NC093_06670 [Alistipes sp.]|nr:hypothetical protein [Alistipes sp.]